MNRSTCEQRAVSMGAYDALPETVRRALVCCDINISPVKVRTALRRGVDVSDVVDNILDVQFDLEVRF